MTLGGTVNKPGILLILCLATASIVWNRFFESGNPASIMGLLWLGLVPTGPRAISITERLLTRPLGNPGRRVVALVVDDGLEAPA